MITGRFAAMTARVAAANSISRQRSKFHDRRFEKFHRIIEGVRLHVLWQRESHRPAQRRVGEREHRSRKGRQQLRGMDDPIE